MGDTDYLWPIVVGMIVVTALMVWYSSCREERVQNRHREAMADVSVAVPTETIFVSVPNYCDPETPWTIISLLTAAHLPHRIYVGVCHQTEDSNPRRASLLQELCALASQVEYRELFAFTNDPTTFLLTHVRVECVPHKLARGPTQARAAIEKRLYAQEKYILMIDSHMRFVRDWDELALQSLHRCASDRPILTMPPPSSASGPGALVLEGSSPPFTTLVHAVDKTTGFIRTGARQFASAPLRPIAQLTWTPCFSFTFAAAHLEVPYDPNLRNLFHGECHLMSARLWTHGWDFYAPVVSLCTHRADRAYRPDFKSLGKSPDDAVLRAQCLLGIRSWETARSSLQIDIARYGLGTRRSLADFHRWCDVDMKAMTVGQRGRSGISGNAPKDEVIFKYGGFAELRYARMCERNV